MSKNNYADQAILEYLKNSGNNTKSGYGNLANQYQNIVNQPNAADAIGDAFTRGGSGQAIGPAQQQSNALQLGIGAGAKAYANDQKASSLQGIEQLTSQLLEQNAILEQQMLDNQVNSQKINQFFKQSAVNIAELSRASMAGDKRASNELAQNILRSYKQITGDETVGEFDHYNNGSIYYENPETGNIEGRNIMNALYQSGINPGEIWGQDFVDVERGLSPGAAKNYKNTEEERALALQKARSDIGLTQAHTDLYNAQTANTNKEMNAPAPKYNEKVLQTIATDNVKWVNELKDKREKLSKEQKAYAEIAKIITKENEIGGRAGTSLLAKTQRVLNNANTASEKHQALIELYKQPLMAGIKEIFAGSTSDNDTATFLLTLPSLDKNPEASIKVAKERAADLQNRIENDDLTADILENEFGFKEPYNSRAVQNKVTERKNKIKEQQQSGKLPPNNDFSDL